MALPFAKGSLVVTSIAAPNAVLKLLAEGSMAEGSRFIVIGDSKSPAEFELDGCDFYGLNRQAGLPFDYAALCPQRSYTRKNIGYLLAIMGGAEFIVETDDDNFPMEEFWLPRERVINGASPQGRGWVNVYGYFSETSIYPRGFPLEQVTSSRRLLAALGAAAATNCPIQQGLADRNPDVDAIYRMLFPLPHDFNKREPVILGAGQWCPYNSQNTTTFPEAYPLLYLPAFCSFRMTDIWRSFVAQRVAWACGWSVAFHASTVYQDRNEHNLLADFADEVSGYLNNAKIAMTLETLELQPGVENIGANMIRCYQSLVGLGLVKADELKLLAAWLSDLAALRT